MRSDVLKIDVELFFFSSSFRARTLRLFYYILILFYHLEYRILIG